MAVAGEVRPIDTTTTGRGSSSAWTWSLSSLPADLLEQSCKRIAIVAMVFAGLWLLPLIINPFALRFAPGDPFAAGSAWPMPGRLLAGVGLAMSLAMVLLAAKRKTTPAVLLNIGLGFEVATALLIGVLNQWQPVLVPGRTSWICIIILVYPAIVPNTPGKTFAAAFAAASMDPLGFGIALARHADIVGEFTAFTAVWYFLPVYLCAVLAVIPVHVIRKLGRQVSRARELGSYRLGDPIGTGGMGEVYRAEHRLLARPAAIKLIRPALLSASRRDATVSLERFRREAQAAALLRSPHTIELYDFGVAEDGTFYLVMELLDGLSLEELVERFGPLPAERAIYLMRQACASLAEAHSTGLMHRDIKPSNIFTNRLGLDVDFVKVLDFGLVKAEPGSGAEQTMLTAPEVTTGTPAFMAPEVALGEETADHRLDVYSLGAVLYWLLTGELIFEASNAIKMMHKHIGDTPIPPSRRTELDIPPTLDDIVMACLAKDPAARPPDAAALSRQLAAVELAHPWTPERAERWWAMHLPGCRTVDDPCNQGTLIPALSVAG